MYRLTCKLLALFSLVLPTLAATVISGQVGELDKRDIVPFNGRVYVTCSRSIHCADHFPRREPGTILVMAAPVVVEKQILMKILLSRCL
jgi:hypothetical protein